MATPLEKVSTPLTRLLEMILGWFFSKVGIDAAAVESIRQASLQGPLVLVMRTRSALDRAYVSWLARRLGLPAVHTLGRHDKVPEPAALAQALGLATAEQPRGALLIFLRRSASFRAHGVAERDPFAALVALERRDHPGVRLIPLLLVWSRRAQHLRPTLRDVVFGAPEAPGVIASFVGFLRHHRRAFLRVGRPIDLGTVAAERAEEDDATLGRKLRGVLHVHLGRQLRAVLGPPVKDPVRFRQEVLRDRGLRALMEKVAAERHTPIATVEAAVERSLAAIAARMSPGLLEFIRPMVTWSIHSLYDDVVIDDADVDLLRRASTQAPVVLCPNHQSHMDYVLLTWLTYTRGLYPPHVAAGDNLAFFPFGPFARRVGGFFIRRSIKGDKLYAATLRAYVKHLLRGGLMQEFFIEGGRSRSGKLLPPRTGLLAMEVDAWLDGASDDVLFLPVAISYDKLAEAHSHVRELAGAQKRKEDARSLLWVGRKLGSRHGRIHVAFDPPVSLRALCEERGGAPTDERGMRGLVQQLANRIAHGIGNAAPLTAVGLTASALLADGRARVTREELGRRMATLSLCGQAAGARLAIELSGSSWSPAFDEALALLARDGLTIVEEGGQAFAVPAHRRAELDYYRNNVVHRFVAPAILATALTARRADQAGPDAEAAVRADAIALSRLFKLEFVYRSDVRFDRIFADTRALFAEGRLGEREGALALLAGFLAPFLAAYATMLAVFADGQGGPRRDLVQAALDRCRADAAAGRLRHTEASSKATLDNAFDWLLDRALVTPTDDGYRLAPDRQAEAASLREDLARFRAAAEASAGEASAASAATGPAPLAATAGSSR